MAINRTAKNVMIISGIPRSKNNARHATLGKLSNDMISMAGNGDDDFLFDMVIFAFCYGGMSISKFNNKHIESNRGKMYYGNHKGNVRHCF